MTIILTLRTWRHSTILIIMLFVVGIGTFYAFTATTASAQDTQERSERKGDAYTEANKPITPLIEKKEFDDYTTGNMQKQNKKYGVWEDVLLTEGIILLYSSVSFIENGAGIMGGLMILSSPLAFNNNSIATFEEPIVAFAGFIILGGYNIYMEGRDIPKNEMFWNNVIAMNTLALSIVAAHFYGHPLKTPQKQGKAYLKLLADNRSIYGTLNLNW